MPQVISHENQRIAFRISSEDKAILTKAAELSHTNNGIYVATGITQSA